MRNLEDDELMAAIESLSEEALAQLYLYGGPEGHSPVDGRTFKSLTSEQHAHSNDQRSTMRHSNH